MKPNQKHLLIVLVVLVVWMFIFIVLFDKKVGFSVFLLFGQPGDTGRRQTREDGLGELGNSVEDSNNKRPRCLQTLDSHGHLKKAWPIPAVLGDAGYNGTGININRSQLPGRERTIYDLGLKIYKVNKFASDLLPLRRNINLYMPECQHLTFDSTTLPTAGIVLIFHDEIWSVLLRTVFSILDAGPYHLITEIVLVDDASKKDHLGRPLEEYIKIFGGKVKVVRLPKRKGLIAARLAGFDHVTGDVVIFLDAHSEVHTGWLEPLLDRIKQDDSVIAIPTLDAIDLDTFQYKFLPNKDQRRYGFDFTMKPNRFDRPPTDGVHRKTLADPIPTPVHLGCCLAASKRNFERLGKYDPELEIWGCENLELSFKAWMCSGGLELIPCSHVAHLYRPSRPYNDDGLWLADFRNCLRVAEVWMDQYKVFYLDVLSSLQLTSLIDIGDIGPRKALREELKCRSFDWYLNQVYPQVYLPVNTTAAGLVSNARDPSLCLNVNFLQASSTNPPNLIKCDSHQMNTYFYLSKERQIRREGKCLSYDLSAKSFVWGKCPFLPGQWEYRQDRTMNFLTSDLCMTYNNNQVLMTACNSSDISQLWNWPRKTFSLN